MGADKLLKIPQMPPNLSAQTFCPSPNFWDIDEKRLYCWVSVVRAQVLSKHK